MPKSSCGEGRGEGQSHGGPGERPAPTPHTEPRGEPPSLPVGLPVCKPKQCPEGRQSPRAPVLGETEHVRSQPEKPGTVPRTRKEPWKPSRRPSRSSNRGGFPAPKPAPPPTHTHLPSKGSKYGNPNRKHEFQVAPAAGTKTGWHLSPGKALHTRAKEAPGKLCPGCSRERSGWRSGRPAGAPTAPVWEPCPTRHTLQAAQFPVRRPAREAPAVSPAASAGWGYSSRPTICLSGGNGSFPSCRKTAWRLVP